jgi:poly(A) polymerase
VQPKIYLASEYDIDHSLIDPDALLVLKKLHQAGFVAYLVGGSVRDLLTKKSPKDVDISTSALPEEIKAIFGRQCFLIGKRFRLAHIHFKHKIIEVSTFRSGEDEADLVMRHNKWGNAEEDVIRRDFTINGLFYDPTNHTIIDYVGGWEDIHKGIIRAIGKPEIRFRQDPVRMIRLLKFRARFGFAVEPETEQALHLHKEDIVKSAPARILEEIFRMLESGYSAPFFRLLHEYNMLHLLFPSLVSFLKSKHGVKVFRYLSSADQVVQHKGKNVFDRAVLTSCLIFPILEQEIQKQYLSHGVIPHIGEIMLLTMSIIKAVFSTSFTHFPRRISSTMSFILTNQYRLTPIQGKRHYRTKLMHTHEFGLSLKFLKLRAIIDERLVEAYTIWRDLYYRERQHKERKGHPPPTLKRPGH